MTKRLGIYRILNHQDYLDKYIYFMIEKMCPYIDKVLVFCNSTISDTSIMKMKNRKHVIVIRTDNYDAEVLKVLHHDEINRYEEVLFWDDSIYGPIYDLDILKKSQESSEWDCWSISAIYSQKEKRLQPQSYYVIFKTYIFTESFFDELSREEISKDVINCIIKKVCDWGYLNITFIQNDSYVTEQRKCETDYSTQLSYDLIKFQKCPFVRKDGLINVNVSCAGDENARNTIQYIQEYTDYDTEMIWENLLHTENVIDLKRAFHLEYVLPYDCIIHELRTMPKCAVIIHLYYRDLLKYSLEYISHVPDEIDLYFTVSNEQLKSELDAGLKAIGRRNYHYVWKKDNRGRDISALLVTCKDILMKYDILCFVHDKKTSLNSPKFTVGKSWFYNLWENTLKSDKYIYNVLRTLEANKKLGILVPPEPCQNSHAHIYGDEWRNNYHIAEELIEKWGIKCNLDKNKMPFTLGSVFWCKTDALKPLFQLGLQYEDFPEEPMPADGTLGHAIERIIAYVAQSQGYYTGICMNTDFASIRGDKLENMMIRQKNNFLKDDFAKEIYKKCGQEISIIRLIRFCNSVDKLYIYGAGHYGQICADILHLLNRKFEKFVVTEKQGQQPVIKKHAVIALKELTMNETEDGIIVALNKKNCEKVIPQLHNRNIGKVYLLLDNE